MNRRRLGTGLALAVLVSSPLARAACNVIPSAQRLFPSTLGVAEQPFGSPGATVTIRRETAVFDADPAGNEIVLRFASGKGRSEPIRERATPLAPETGSSCPPSDCTGQRCLCVRFVFPDTDLRLAPKGDGRGLTGPVKIRVQTGRTTTALIDTFFSAPVPEQHIVDPVFPSFVALPKPNAVRDLVTGAGDVLGASDAAGNLFVPLAFSPLVSDDDGQTRFIEAGIPALAPFEQVEIESFTPAGQRLPPLIARSGDVNVIGTADAPESVLRIAGGAHLLDVEPNRLPGPIVIAGVTAVADPRERADPISLLRGERFAVFESRECTDDGCLDLNGDGDTRDYLLSALDLQTPSATPMLIDQVDVTDFPGIDPSARPPTVYSFQTTDRIVTFNVAEQLSVDLNADGDRDDLVRSGAFDLVRQQRVDAADGAARLEAADALLAFGFEAAPGIDVLAYYDAAAAEPAPALVTDASHEFFVVPRTTIFGPNVSIPFDFAVGDGRIAFVVPENVQDEDLTGDGDRIDFALLLFDPATGTVTNLQRGGSRALHLGSGLLAFNEARPDGTTSVALIDPRHPGPPLFHICDQPPLSGSVLAGFSPALLPCVVLEQGVDLNGNGSQQDFVLHVLTADSPFGLAEFDLGLAMASLFDVQAKGDTLVVGVSEALQGVDLDGDGVVEPVLGPYGPFALLTFHAPTGRLDSFGVSVVQTFPPASEFVDGGYALLQATVDDQGVPGARRVFLRDLDGDGRFEDFLLRLPEDGTIVPMDNCPVDSNPTQTDLDGDQRGDACDPLSPGRGAAAEDTCVTEFAAGGTFTEKAVVRCHDGEPLCDFDDVAGQCTFRIAGCFLVHDERFPACDPAGAAISRVAISGARTVGGIDGLTDAIAALSGGTAAAGAVLFDPPLAAASDSSPICSEVASLVVPARAGRAAPRVAIDTTLADGRVERSVIGLQCSKSNGSPRHRHSP